MTRNAQGHRSLLLLQLLAERESYGYEVVQRLHETGLTDVLEGTVYPALSRLEREGRVCARLVVIALRSGPQVLPPNQAGYEALAPVRRAGHRWPPSWTRRWTVPCPPHPIEGT